MTNPCLAGQLAHERQQAERVATLARLDARIALCRSQREKEAVHTLYLEGKCFHFQEDPNICHDFGEPKGQCAHCGDYAEAHAQPAIAAHERM